MVKQNFDITVQNRTGLCLMKNLLLSIFLSLICLLFAGCITTDYKTCYGNTCATNCEVSLKLCNCNKDDCKYKYNECLKTCDRIEKRTLENPNSDMVCGYRN